MAERSCDNLFITAVGRVIKLLKNDSPFLPAFYLPINLLENVPWHTQETTLFVPYVITFLHLTKLIIFVCID
jgi:hypothetical protein